MTNDRVAGVLGGSPEDWAEYDRDNEEMFTDDFERKYFKPVKGRQLSGRVKEELARDQGTETVNKKQYHMKRCFICYRPVPAGIEVTIYKRDRIFPFKESMGRMCPVHKEGIDVKDAELPELTPAEAWEATAKTHTITEIREAIKAAQEAKAKRFAGAAEE